MMAVTGVSRTRSAGRRLARPDLDRATLFEAVSRRAHCLVLKEQFSACAGFSEGMALNELRQNGLISIGRLFVDGQSAPAGSAEWTAFAGELALIDNVKRRSIALEIDALNCP